ncbi:MAG: ABZJ_00895 family protein [Pseudomonadota bacterium]
MLKKLDKNARFGLLFMFVAICALIVVLVLRLVLGFVVGAGAVSFAVPLIAGMFAGKWHVEDVGAPDSSKLLSESLRFALIAFLIVLAITLMMFLSPQRPGSLQSIPIYTWVGAPIVAIVVIGLGIRLGFGIGVRSALNKS